MAEIPMDEILERQAALAEAMQQIADEADPNRLMEMASALQEQAMELQALAKQFEEQELAKAAPPAANVEVRLTPAQRKRVLDETGEDMELLVLADPGGLISRNMPQTPPELIEFWALEEARRRKLGAEVAEGVQQELANAINEIREQGTPALVELLDERLADPEFLAGVRPK